MQVPEKLELCTLQVAKNKLMKHVEDLTLRFQLEKLIDMDNGKKMKATFSFKEM
ncbi:hypothetical protein CsatA_030551 [Cannabis sativa]